MSSNPLGKRKSELLEHGKSKQPEKKIKTGAGEGTPVVKRKAAPKTEDSVKQQRKASPKDKSQGTQKAKSPRKPRNPPNPENSVPVRTKRFVELATENKGLLEVKQAAALLTNDKTERIYELCNVFVGAGLVDKLGKGAYDCGGYREEQEVEMQLRDIQEKLAALMQSDDYRKFGGMV